MDYLYRLSTLYPEDRTQPSIDLKSKKIFCFDVAPVEPGPLGRVIGGEKGRAWTFSVRGIEGRFRTNYSWALIRNDAESKATLREIDAIGDEIKSLQKEVSRLWEDIGTAAKDLEAKDPAVEED